MKHFPHYDDFPRGVSSFEQAIGEPDAASSAIGYVAIRFSWLEEELSLAIQHLLALDPKASAVLAAETSFRAKVNMVGALMRLRHEDGTFRNGWTAPLDAMTELSALCFRAEEYRNQIMHSIWGTPHEDDASISRTRGTARGRLGLRVNTERMTPNDILAVSEFIANVHFDVMEFFGVLSRPTASDS